MKIVTEEEISSKHWLPDYIGKCREEHGHNWRVIVMVEGTLLTEGPNKGMVMDFSVIKKILNIYDHNNLNKYFDTPTAEVMAMQFCQDILARGEEQGNVSRVVVRIYETSRNYAEATSDDLPVSKLEQDLFTRKNGDAHKTEGEDKDVGDGSNS